MEIKEINLPVPEEGYLPNGRPQTVLEYRGQLYKCACALRDARQQVGILERQLQAKSVDYDQYHNIMAIHGEITYYITNNYRREMARGDHRGMTLPQIIAHYLSIERGRFSVRLGRLLRKVIGLWQDATGPEGGQQ